MIINHNMNAMNAHRMMGMNTVNSGKSMEKLSSGLRINRAGDDAAGLAISEKMRGQIRGLDQASRNAQDGISMLQTGEGALNETHSILQRMRELANQAGNDTNTEKDRAEIQKEMNQLTSEINRIGNTTEFNTQSLLKGESNVKVKNTTSGVKDAVQGKEAKAIVAGLTIKSGEDNGVKGNINVEIVTGTGNTSAAYAGGKLTIKIGDTAGEDAADKIKAAVNGVMSADGINFSKFDVTGTSTATATAETGKLTGGKDAVNVTQGVDEISGTLKAGKIKIDGEELTIEGKDKNELYEDLKAKIEANTELNGKYTVGTYTKDSNKLALTQQAGKESSQGVKVETSAKSFTMQVGANENQTMTLEFEDMRSAALGITGTSGANGFTAENGVTDGTNDTLAEAALDVSNSINAGNAVTKIQEAIDKVSGERSKLGAYQNRLEHTINNLGTSSENLSAAESRVRDVDMAKEMMNFGKNNILSQAAQAMLAQANQQPQGVLQLLR